MISAEPPRRLRRSGPAAEAQGVRRRIIEGVRMTKAILLLATLAAAGSHDLLGQATPEDAARVFAAAVRASDWPGAARLMHPDALRQLRALFAPIIGAAGMESVRTQMFGVESAAAFAALPDTVLFARFFRNVMAQQQGLAEALRTATTTVFGHVAQSPDTMLVVSRTSLSVEGVTIRQFEVMPFARYQGQWRGLLKADFTNMAEMMKRAIAKRS